MRHLVQGGSETFSVTLSGVRRRSGVDVHSVKLPVAPLAKRAIIAIPRGGHMMKCMSAKDAKNAFGLLLDNARAEPVTVEKHGRPVVVVMSIEEFERLSLLERGQRPDAGQT